LGAQQHEAEPVEPPPLTAWVEDVSTLGLVQIKFSHPLDLGLLKPKFISDRTLSVFVEKMTEEEEKGADLGDSLVWELYSLDPRVMAI